MKSTREKVSYCIGLETGRNLKRQFNDMDSGLLEKGFEDGIMENTPKLSQEEIQSIMQALRQQIEQQQKQYFAKVSEQNKNEGETYLEENKQKDGVRVLKSGLQYKVIQNGNGDKPTPVDVVSVHYRGSFINGSIFDSNSKFLASVNVVLNQRLVGQTVDVLVDAGSRRQTTELSGRTSTNVVVNLPGPPEWIGRTLAVRIERAGPHSVWGKVTAEGTGVPGL
jgi:FKBP-type peptidyl-prolyl cis-trans isomerase FklB